MSAASAAWTFSPWDIVTGTGCGNLASPSLSRPADAAVRTHAMKAVGFSKVWSLGDGWVWPLVPLVDFFEEPLGEPSSAKLVSRPYKMADPRVPGQVVSFVVWFPLDSP